MKVARAAGAMVAMAFAAVLFGTAGGHAQSRDDAEWRFEPDRPLLTVYGPRAPTREGDHDHLQVIYLSVPADFAERAFLRVFDPETIGRYDTPFGSPTDTRTRFSVYGGETVMIAPDGAAVPAGDDLAAGKLIAERTFASRREDDARWQTIAELDPVEGELAGENRLFRLVVRTLRGNDGNVFSLALSASETANNDIAGARIFSHLPTLRVADDRTLTELRFSVPPGAKKLTVSNFDASFGSVVFTSAFRSLTLGESGQDLWRTTTIDLQPSEQGEVAALTFRGGEEIPNDLSVHAETDTGAAIEFDLPPRTWLPNARPEVKVATVPRSCEAVSVSAAGTLDEDGDGVNYLWRFDDGSTARGVLFTRSFPKPGVYQARLEARDTSGQVGNGTARDFVIRVKPRPVATATAPVVAAPGEPVDFDASASSSELQKIARYDWTLADGRMLEGAAVRAVFMDPGLYRAHVRVTDDSGHPCDTDDASVAVRVNARPAAEAGPDRYVAAGETVRFDASQSSDSDGTLAAFRWDLGDGTVKTGRVVEHAHTAPGAYTVTLRATDGSDAANAVGLDTARVTVNARPMARLGEDIAAERGETIAFDASASTDVDGDPLTYRWDFGNGETGAGATPSYAYQDVGTYRVTVTVDDGSGLANARHSATLTVTVGHPPNQAPVAEAGADVTAVIGEVIAFDASASRDPGGNIASYEWDFGDGGRTTGVRPVHTFWKEGEYTVRLTVTDDYAPAPESVEDTLTVRVEVPPNTAPVARAGEDLSVRVGEVIAFDATASHDPDGNIVAFDWDFGDGGKGRGIRPIHAYHHAGTYRVRLTIRDDGPVEAGAADTLTVTVEEK